MCCSSDHRDTLAAVAEYPVKTTTTKTTTTATTFTNSILTFCSFFPSFVERDSAAGGSLVFYLHTYTPTRCFVDSTPPVSLNVWTGNHQACHCFFVRSKNNGHRGTCWGCVGDLFVLLMHYRKRVFDGTYTTHNQHKPLAAVPPFPDPFECSCCFCWHSASRCDGLLNSIFSPTFFCFFHCLLVLFFFTETFLRPSSPLLFSHRLFFYFWYPPALIWCIVVDW